jgi:hypothetical protein
MKAYIKTPAKLAEWDGQEERSTAGRKTLGMSGRQLAHAEHDENKIKSLRENSEPWGEIEPMDQDFQVSCPPTQGYRKSALSGSSRSNSGSPLGTESRPQARDISVDSSKKLPNPHAWASGGAQPSAEPPSSHRRKEARL